MAGLQFDWLRDKEKMYFRNASKVSNDELQSFYDLENPADEI